VEPNGPLPTHDADFKGAPDWFSDSAHVKPFGLGEVPLAYDPPVSEDRPTSADLVRCWARQEPARKLVGLPITHPMTTARCGIWPGRGEEHLPAPPRHRHSRQWPYDDAGEEQRRHRKGDGRLSTRRCRRPPAKASLGIPSQRHLLRGYARPSGSAARAARQA
jgi:hypothetical protein